MRYAKYLPENSLRICEFSASPGEGWTPVSVEAYSTPRPSSKHSRALVDGELVWLDQRTLEQAQTEKLRVLRDARETALNDVFVWDGSTFDSDQVSQTRLMGIYVDSQSGYFVAQPWRLADNSWRVLELADVPGVWAALKAHITAQFTAFAALETVVLAPGVTIAEVDAVTWGE